MSESVRPEVGFDPNDHVAAITELLQLAQLELVFEPTTARELRQSLTGMYEILVQQHKPLEVILRCGIADSSTQLPSPEDVFLAVHYILAKQEAGIDLVATYPLHATRETISAYQNLVYPGVYFRTAPEDKFNWPAITGQAAQDLVLLEQLYRHE